MNDNKRFVTFNTLMFAVSQKPFKHLISIFLCIIHALSSVAVTIVLQKFLDYSISVKDSVKILPVLVLGCVLIWSMLSMLFNNYFYDLVSYDFQEAVSKKLFKKISSAPFENFEDAKFLDDVQKSKEGIQAYSSLYALVYMLLFFYVPYFVVLELFYYSMSPKLVLIVLVTFIPELVSQILRVRMYAKLEDKSVPLIRKHELFEKYSVDREFFKETRVSGSTDYFSRLIKNNLHKLAKVKIYTEFKSAFLQIFLKVITFSGMAVSLAFLIGEFKNDKISAGAFAGVFQSLFLTLAYIDEIVQFHFGELSKKMGKIRNYNSVCNSEYKSVSLLCSDSDAIYFNNVSYCYPGKNEPALKNISFSVKAGENIAVVGYNGAGKSTLAKILLGLVKPSDGKVVFPSTFVVNENLSSSALFQDFQKYKMTMGENVGIGNHFESSDDDVKILLEKSGVDLSLFPDGTDTFLAPEFGGIDVSGGQWQRLGIARAMSKKHDLLVLDEPTSAIDPLEETRLYNLFKEMGNGKTMFIITHRIGAAQLADRILVLDNGRIVEEGSHEKLMLNRGLYYSMYHEQSKWYE